jgi:hypothetical protein
MREQLPNEQINYSEKIAKILNEIKNKCSNSPEGIRLRIFHLIQDHVRNKGHVPNNIQYFLENGIEMYQLAYCGGYKKMVKQYVNCMKEN